MKTQHSQKLTNTIKNLKKKKDLEGATGSQRTETKGTAGLLCSGRPSTESSPPGPAPLG